MGFGVSWKGKVITRRWVASVGTWVGFWAGIREGGKCRKFERGSASSAFFLLWLGEGFRYLVPTYLCQKLQDGSFPVREHINQGLDEVGAFFVMSVGNVPWGLQRNGLRGAPMEVGGRVCVGCEGAWKLSLIHISEPTRHRS